jgi:hypothetical protein
VPPATTTAPGIVELATSAETITGTDTERATTPAGVDAAIAAAVGTTVPDATATVKGIVELATSAEAVTGTDTVRAVTPAGADALVDDRLTSGLSNVAVEGHTHTASDITDLEAELISLGYIKAQAYDSALGGSPGAITPNTLWIDTTTAPSVSPSIAYVTHQQDTANTTSWTFTPENLLSAFPDYDYFIAFVHTGNSTTPPANDADTLTGGGMIWNPEGTAISSGNNIITTQVFKTSGGTPNGTNLVVGATGGAEGASIQVVAVRDLAYDETFKSSPGGGSGGTLTLTGATSNQRAIVAVAYNSSAITVTADPGTPLGGTPDVTMASPSIRSRASVMNPAAVTANWTLSGSSSKTCAGVLVGTP